MAIDAPAEITSYSLLIDGRSVPALSGETFDTVSPTTNRPIGRIAKAGVEDVEAAILAARRAFDTGPWPRSTPLERSQSSGGSRTFSAPGSARSPGLRP